MPIDDDIFGDDDDDEIYIESCSICGGDLEDGWCPYCAEVADDEAFYEYGEVDEANKP